MAKEINVLVAGALGKMGGETIRTVKQSEDTNLIGAVDVKAREQKLSFITGDESDNQEIWTDLDEALEILKPDVLVDFTNPQAVYVNSRTALRKGVPCIIGTTGLSDKELESLDQIARENQVAIAVIPNFAIGAILMMKFAQEAARYFGDVEIIELHHDGKLDAPSGTAIKTAEMIREIREIDGTGIKGEFEKYTGARGGKVQGISVHSVRLPGFVAHQEVIFGGTGQALTIRHDAFNRECFMPGVILAIKKIQTFTGLVYGLEKMI
ncbi:MAG: 4-hydroxy-tetrahydrodipicolinate reductase [Ignavibacteriales bacterium]